MAKTTGPLFSLTASGSVAKTITYSAWKGISYVRQLVIPANPQTADQAAVRSTLGAIAKAALAVLTSFKDMADVGSPFFTAARDAAPSGQSWVSFMQHSIYPVIGTVDSAWSGLGGTKQGYFTNTAGDVSLTDYDPTYPDGTSRPAGELLFILAYFASNYLSGSIKTLADTAIAGANQTDVDNFGDAVHLTTP